MKRKILVALLALVILSQAPFAFRRYRLRRLHNAIEALTSQRKSTVNDRDLVDYQGVIHVHSSLGGHSTGSFAEIITAAKANQLDFVIMTEHPQADFDTSSLTLNGEHAGILFINGNEVVSRDGDRLLLIPGVADAASINTESTATIVQQEKQDGGLSFAAYPADSQTWSQSPVDGVEVYNLFTNARSANKTILFLDGLWSYRSYPDLMFANFFTRPSENLKLWDEASTAHKLTAIAGNDAHSNIGLSLNDASGKQWLGVKLDPYERSFRVVRTHVLIPREKALTRESLLEALSRGHCYISFDLLAEGRGFDFYVAQNATGMGDEIQSADGLQLAASSPQTTRFALFKDGILVAQRTGTSALFPLTAKGTYRIECYLDSLPPPITNQPWIISNAIYVR